MFRIKICGITTPDDALLAAEAGADAIGLNFFEGSPRYVDPQAGAGIAERLREEFPHVTVAALFVNSTLDDILWTLRDADLYGPERRLAVQIHGDEPPELLAGLRGQGLGVTDSLLQATGHLPVVPVIRALRCRDSSLGEAAAYLRTCQELGALPQGVLLDAYAPGSFGGSGHKLDWSAVAARSNQLLGLPVALAGGLTPENVAAAIAASRPDAVDVASGVESSPGRKDAAKVLAFVARAKAAFEGGQQVSG